MTMNSDMASLPVRRRPSKQEKKACKKHGRKDRCWMNGKGKFQFSGEGVKPWSAFTA